MPSRPEPEGGERVELEQLQPLASNTPAIPSPPLVEKLPIVLTVELGRTTLSVKELKTLRKGQIISLDKVIGETLGIFANGQRLAAGEVVAVAQDHYGVRVLSLVEEADQPNGTPL
ncbi:FliM/FliN family flagellar motor switch protein [Acidisoma silvae]|uniref:Flagellar motor switch protein FliN n=1 Tax=Acidisoma silvae TaxID=2802396 RepID=A0A963YQ67_9PROT|nr:FliM/FliN family flagellar motor switch protein [Acidisoma silvae]MCB8874915.1 FliM/FliN family flagellar motor switch protein [Acidisoma silvae]